MQISDSFTRYLTCYPHEAARLRLLAKQLQCGDDELTQRTNFVGHVTASAFIVNPATKQVLLLQHKSLGSLLQPGGHVEPADKTILAAAKREVMEETGLGRSQLQLRSLYADNPQVPFDIDTHFIPENPKKGERGHYHHDFRYLFVTKETGVTIDPDESNGFAWVDWDTFRAHARFEVVAGKIEALLGGSHKDSDLTGVK
jgi:hypothetical protein